MPPDPVRAADARAWLAKAAQDLRPAGLLLAAEPPDPEGGLFHSQQAAEKALKGFLTWHDVHLAREVMDAILGRLPLEVRPL